MYWLNIQYRYFNNNYRYELKITAISPDEFVDQYMRKQVKSFADYFVN